jgi:hypothetical protein
VNFNAILLLNGQESLTVSPNQHTAGLAAVHLISVLLFVKRWAGLFWWIAIAKLVLQSQSTLCDSAGLRFEITWVIKSKIP